MSESLRFEKSKLIFKNKGNSNRLFSKMILKNTSSRHIGFQIKGNKPTRYVISNPLGKVGPYQVEEIGIEMTLKDKDLIEPSKINDKFCCFYMYIEPEDADKNEKEIEKILKAKQKNQTIHKLKIQSMIEGSEETNSENTPSEAANLRMFASDFNSNNSSGTEDYNDLRRNFELSSKPRDEQLLVDIDKDDEMEKSLLGDDEDNEEETEVVEKLVSSTPAIIVNAIENPKEMNNILKKVAVPKKESVAKEVPKENIYMVKNPDLVQV